MTEMEELCRWIEGKGFLLISQKGYRIQIYVKNSITIKVEEKRKEQ
jgi:hypothetical protein